MRVVFLDVDGTLLNSRHRLLPCTQSAIRRLGAMGVRVVPASARPPGALCPLAESLHLTSPVIAYNGALVTAGPEPNAPLLGSYHLPPEASAEAMALARQSEVVCSLYRGNDWITPDPDHPLIAAEAAISGLTPRRLDPSPAPGPPWTDRGQGAHKIPLIGRADRLDAIERGADESVRRLGMAASRSKLTYWEWVRAGVSKGTGVSLVLKALGISRRDSAAIGDGANDIPMFQAAGIGVAMGNAPDPVRAAADWVTGAADEDGLADALARLVPSPGIAEKGESR